MPPSDSKSISIVLPLFDCRNAGRRALASALSQRYPRQRYEVVAVTVGGDGDAGDPALTALLARCDCVVRSDLDPAVTANEIRLYLAGLRHCTGELVFCCEGHTELRDDCCALIDDHFSRHRDCEIAWALRLNHATSALGRLVAMHNDRHQRRADAGGVYSLGANSVIRRDTLEALGGLEPRYLRFSETALFHRAVQRGTVVGHIEKALATHYNDMTETLWLDLARNTGAGRYAYYSDLFAQGHAHRARIRHPVYAYARLGPIAALLMPASRASAAILLRVAVHALRINSRLAYSCYVLALACADLAGYTDAAARRASRGASQGMASGPAGRGKASAAADQAFDARDDLSRVGRPDAFDQRLTEIRQEIP